MKPVFEDIYTYVTIPQMVKENIRFEVGSPERYNFYKFFSEHKPSFDIDGVLIDSLKYVTELFNKDHKTNYVPTDMRKFNMVNEWLKEMGFSEEYINKKRYEYWYSEKLFDAPLIADAKEFLESLYDAGVEITVVSSRPDHLRTGTVKVLTDNIPFLKEENIFIQNNHEMTGDVYKTFIINKRNIGIHFEDLQDHAKTVLDHTKSMIGLMSNIDGLNESFYDGRIIRFKGKTPLLLPDFGDVSARFNYS